MKTSSKSILLIACWMIIAITAPATSQELAVSSPQSSHSGSLVIGAFNIRIFGVSKVSQVEVVDILVKILQRCDLVLIQEIRDKSMTAIHTLLDKLNSAIDDNVDTYEMLLSSRLGRTSSKEQYAYFYKPSRVSFIWSYIFNDTANDVFEREPYVAYFASPTTDVDAFAMIGIHIKPSDAIEEMNQLVNVYNDYVNRTGNENAIIAGDFNADCSYASNTALRNTLLRTDDRFTWLISDDADTTLAASDCSYDRFVIAGNELRKNVDPNLTRVFRFDEEYGLDGDMATDVSDHYPIEMGLRENLNLAYEPATTTTVTSDCVRHSSPCIMVKILLIIAWLVCM